MHLSVGIVKVPDHLKPSLHSFSSPPLDSRWTERADINKYIMRREFKGTRTAFLLSSCQRRVNNGNIKMCRGAATHSYPSLPTRRIKAERDWSYWLLWGKWESVEYCKQVTACTLNIKMSSKLQRCCKNVFTFKCFNPNVNKKDSSCEENSQERQLQATYCSLSPKNMSNAPQSLSFFNMLVFSLLLWCLLDRRFVHWTWTFPRGAVKTKPDFNPIGVICTATAPSSPSVWPLIRCGYITLTHSGAGVATRAPCRWLPHPAGSPVGRGCRSKWFSQSPLPLQWVI